MTTAQVAAFSKSTGGVSPATLLTAIASILAVIYLLWLAWMAYSQLRSWQTGQGTLYDVILIILRAAVIALLAGYLIR